MTIYTDKKCRVQTLADGGAIEVPQPMRIAM
jgi:hypothetical protein